MQSMTGFGAGRATIGGREITIELKSINHRYLDLNFRMPRSLGFLEEPLRNNLSQKFARGHVDVYISYGNHREDDKQIAIDEGLLKQYVAAQQKIEDLVSADYQGEFAQIPRGHWATLPGILTVSQLPEDEAAVAELMQVALDEAMERLTRMRTAEGERLKADLLQRLSTVQKMIGHVKERTPELVGEYQKKLHERIAELLNGYVIDESRLAAEVAIYADKSDVTEEITRFYSHIQAFCDALEESPCGRKIDFIIQELNRETNTIGSKCGDSTIQKDIVQLKTELEKIREQVQNIE